MRSALWMSLLSAVIAEPGWGQVCDPTSPQLGLYDLGTGTYKTFVGGLYANGTNARPAAHEAAGLAIAGSIEPLNSEGLPDPEGRIVLISIGYSNMTQEWATGASGEPDSVELTFKAKAQRLRATGQINPKLLIVDGAQGGMSTDRWGGAAESGPASLESGPAATGCGGFEPVSGAGGLHESGPPASFRVHGR